MSGQITIRLLTEEERDAETGWDEGDLVYVPGRGLSAYDGTGWVFGGGGGALREVDLGTVSVVDAATLGPQVVLSLAEGEYAYHMKAYAGNVLADVDTGAYIGVMARMPIDGPAPLALGIIETANFEAALLDPDADGGDFVNVPTQIVPGPVDIVMVWFPAQAAAYVDSPPVTRQNLHAYALGVWTIQDDANNADAPSLWLVTTAGTSAASPPTWNGAAPVTDGSVVWTVQGPVPTVGSGRFSITVVKPG